MSSHVNNQNHIKVNFDNFASARVQCNKYNAKLDNLYKKKMTPYKCKICQKIHIGHDGKKIITPEVRKTATLKIDECLSKSILIKTIQL